MWRGVTTRLFASAAASTAKATLPKDLSHVVQLGHPRLDEIAEPVQRGELASPEFVAQKELLQNTLERFRELVGFGRGIAAPQIDYGKRMIALNVKEKGRLVVINPEYTYKSKEMFTLWDDCMSFPSLLVKVQRHVCVSLRFTDERGNEHHWENLPANLSELMQHEIDHLDGVLAVDRAINEKGQRGIVSRDFWVANKDAMKKQVDYTIY